MLRLGLALAAVAIICGPLERRGSAETQTYPPASDHGQQCAQAPLDSRETATTQQGIDPMANAPQRNRTVNIGFEDVTSNDPARITELARQLDSVNATGVSISVGRLDWLGFPSEEFQDSHSHPVAQTGRDFVGEAIAALRCTPDGERRSISLNIDTLLGRELDSRPDLAGVNFHGEASENWASISAWKHSGLTDRLEQLSIQLIHRYAPDSINITELMFPAFTFSAADFQDFQDHSGLQSWPRHLDGTIDTESELIHRWRSDAVATIVSRVAQAMEETSVQLTMDVRPPAGVDLRGRLDSGHDYAQLLETVDRLNIWNFQGVNSAGHCATDQLAELFVDQEPSRYGIEIGLWEQGGAISTEALEFELGLAEEHRVPNLSITPTSLMDHDAWNALRRFWGSPY